MHALWKWAQLGLEGQDSDGERRQEWLKVTMQELASFLANIFIPSSPLSLNSLFLLNR